MGSEDSANLVRRGYAAFSTGDMAMLSELFATTQSRTYRKRQPVRREARARCHLGVLR
jgi:ketosteroid isomerase-like protein